MAILHVVCWTCPHHQGGIAYSSNRTITILVSLAACNRVLSLRPTSAKVRQEATVRFYRVYAKQFRGDANSRKINESGGRACIEYMSTIVYKQTAKRRLSFVVSNGLSSREIVRCITVYLHSSGLLLQSKLLADSPRERTKQPCTNKPASSYLHIRCFRNPADIWA